MKWRIDNIKWMWENHVTQIDDIDWEIFWVKKRSTWYR